MAFDSLLHGNVLGLICYFFPALWLFVRTYEAYGERRVNQRKLWLGYGGGVVLAFFAQMIIQLGGIDIDAAVELFVRPLVEMAFLYAGLNHRTFRQHREAGYYGAGLGLSYGATLATIRLISIEEARGELELPGVLLVVATGMTMVLLHGGMGLWLADRLRQGSGIRVAGRLVLLHFAALLLYTLAVDNDHWVVDGGVLLALAMMSGVLYHQGFLRLPTPPETDDDMAASASD